MENSDHRLNICGIVFNHSSSYSAGPEGRTSVRDVTDVAKSEGWAVYQNRVDYSASYAKSAREGTSIRRTSYSRWTTVHKFEAFCDEFFKSVGITTKP